MERYTFFPLAFRMKYINRWGLMRNSVPENLLEHSAECAMLAHALATIANEKFGKNYDVGSIVTKALYHDISEIYTGDLPTPVKYHDAHISASYKEIENSARESLLEKLPQDLKGAYSLALDHESGDEKIIIKAADKLCALIKCIQEQKIGNGEFSKALEANRAAVEKLAESCEALRYFIDNLLCEFERPIDEL
jgi:5'-deoxynucleotidase